MVFDTSGALGKDMFVVKSDSLGNYKWAITTRNIRTMQVNPINMVTDKSGNLYIYGAFQPMGRGSFSFGSFTIQDSIFSEASFLAKISPTGTVLFLKNVMSGFVSGRMGIDDSDNIYISGHYSGTRVIGRDTLTSWPDYACFLGKFDSYGNRIWLKSIVGNSIYGYSVTANGTSYIQSSHSTTVVIGADTLLGSGFHMMKYNANGSLLWVKRLNLNTSYITTDKFENIYSTGPFTGTLIFGRDTLRSHGGMDLYLSKADSANNVIWTRSAGGLRNNIASGVEVDTFGNVLIYGGMMDNLGIDTINFDGIILIPSPLSSDPWFVAQYSTCGKFISALAINSGGDDANSISIPNKGSFYLFGDYIDTLVLANDTFISGPNRELPFIAKFRYNVYHDTMSSTLSGLDSVCKGASISLSSSLTLGTWLVTNGSASVVDGRVTGLSSGWDTILFTTRNACGVSASYKPIYYKGECKRWYYYRTFLSVYRRYYIIE